MGNDYDTVKSDKLLDLQGLESADGGVTEREHVPVTDELESIIGMDDRRWVQNATGAPWQYICALRITMPLGTATGTGWFIGPRTVVTAGHCLYDQRGGGAASKVEVWPARTGAATPFGSRSSSDYRVLDGWVRGQDERRAYSNIAHLDYGAILIDTPFDGLGYFAFAAPRDDASIKFQIANISGYPNQRDNSLKNGANMFWHARQIVNAHATRYEYDIDTFGGQSGAPIWFKNGEKRCVIGIHTSGVIAPGAFNSGVRMTNEVFDVLKAWKTEGSA